MSIAPLTPRAISTAISASVPSASSTGGDVSRPSVTSVPGASTTMPLHSRPMSAMQQADADADRVLQRSGTAVITRSRRPMPAVRMKTIRRSRPRRARPARACRLPTTTVNAKKKLCPIAGATRDRVVREQRHQQRGERRRQARRGQHRAAVHPRRAQHGRLHEDDVGHRQERRDAGEHLGANGRAERGQTKEPLEHGGRQNT